MTPFAQSIKQLIQTYRSALLTAGDASSSWNVDRDTVHQGKGGHGRHGTTTVHHSFGRDVPLPVDLERALDRFVRVWKRRLEAESVPVDAGLSRPGAKHGSVKREEDHAIVAAVGMDPIDLAYLYRRTTEAIRKLRIRHGRDPETGERVRHSALTAPARTTLDALGDAAPDA